MNYDDSAKFELQGSKRKQTEMETLACSCVRGKKSENRTLVRITSLRTRLLDKDNLYGGAKHLLDSIKKSGLIRDDSETEIDYEIKQVKVSHRNEERTEVEIIDA